MGVPYMGELRLMSFNFPPKGWAYCNGQFLPINQNQALFALLGTMYGGNGQTTFALPDLRGRTPIHAGAGFVPGQQLGQEAHVLTMGEMPAHNHVLRGRAGAGDQAAPGTLAGAANAYGPAADLTTLHPASVTSVGGGQAHENMSPYLVVQWCIALQGVFPSWSN
jgi:microcystin-dependent protein